MLDITGVDLRKFVRDVYDLSRPQGLGAMHYAPGPLPEHMIDAILAKRYASVIISMDYVVGRACKMAVIQTEDGKLQIHTPWYDHTDDHLRELLARQGIQWTAGESHNPSCECDSCKQRRKLRIQP